MVNSQGLVDNGKLLSKLQTIILRLDKNKTYRPPNVEAATDYLQQVSWTTSCTCICTVISIDMNGRVCGVLVQFGYYEHRHRRLSKCIKAPSILGLSLELHISCTCTCTCIILKLLVIQCTCNWWVDISAINY